MFDQTREYVIKILSGGEKACRVRFPSYEQWSERTRKQRAVRRMLGRGRTEYEVRNIEDADAELFGAVRLDADGPHFDAAEAGKVIERLERCRVIDVERDGDRFRIAMRVPGGEVLHVLKIPMQQDALDYGRAAVRAIDGRRQQEIRLALEPSADLWAKVCVEVEGYANPDAVPIVHKDVAVVELLAQVEAAQDEDDPED